MKRLIFAGHSYTMHLFKRADGECEIAIGHQGEMAFRKIGRPATPVAETAYAERDFETYLDLFKFVEQPATQQAA